MGKEIELRFNKGLPTEFTVTVDPDRGKVDVRGASSVILLQDFRLEGDSPVQHQPDDCIGVGVTNRLIPHGEIVTRFFRSGSSSKTPSWGIVGPETTLFFPVRAGDPNAEIVVQGQKQGVIRPDAVTLGKLRVHPPKEKKAA